MALLRVRTVWTGVAGTPWYLNLHFSADTGDAQDCVDHTIEFISEVDDYQPASIAWRVEGDVTVIDPATGETIGVISCTGAQGGGSNTGDLVPRSSQAMLRLRTGQYANGRQIQGRILLPGFVESVNNGVGGVDTTSINELAVAAYESLVQNGVGILVVWSRTSGQTPAVQQIVGWGEWAVLRSRRD